MAEKYSRSSHTDNKQSQERSESPNEVRKVDGKDMNPSSCINYGVAVWHESRKAWLGGDQTQRSGKLVKDPIISWSTSYEDLLLTNEPFSEPIPLAEMVDFLVDIWHMEGLFD
ncbi:hypothetical protein MLD38_002556 [Melastoma candidum]|uniref:Uncharacterized protein n=1 Tax=Melastoma candidum TaxID=119954 RepID=A0ACB9RYZ5_9MYRT|nr:hypothetical protein MLD38_002556 [Melastoma candidum]